MKDLSITFCDQDLQNPVMIASGPPGKDSHRIRKCVEAGAAAVVTKTVVPVPLPVPRPRYGLLKEGGRPIGVQNIDTYSEHEVKHWIDNEIVEAKKTGVPVIASIASENIEGIVSLAKIMEQARVDMIELNLSCPHGLRGLIVSQDAQLTKDYVRAVRDSVSMPIMAKLTPNVTDIAEIANAAEHAGADAVSAINTVKALIGVDIYQAKPLLPTFGGYSGPAIKPIALRCVAEIANSVTVPVSGIGGLVTWRDVIEMMMVGATTVQVCTAILLKGYSAITDMVDGIAKFMEQSTYGKPSEFVGLALKQLLPSARFYEMPIKPLKAVVQDSLCTGCGICAKTCFYGAMTMNGKFAVVDQDMCDGCGLCYSLCPRKAISLEDARA